MNYIVPAMVLLESAIEHSKATGENYFLNSIEKYIDHIIDTFGREVGKKRGYPGHQEIELALVKAYEYTNKKKYLDLATYFIEERGKTDSNHKHYFINENEILKKFTKIRLFKTTFQFKRFC